MTLKRTKGIEAMDIRGNYSAEIQAMEIVKLTTDALTTARIYFLASGKQDLIAATLDQSDEIILGPYLGLCKVRVDVSSNGMVTWERIGETVQMPVPLTDYLTFPTPEPTPIPAPTSEERGGVLLQDAIADAEDGDELTTINAMLAALRSAGILAAE